MKIQSKSIVSLMLIFSLLLSSSIVSNAADTFKASAEDGKIIQIAIPDESGILQYYTGEDAQLIYNQIEDSTDVNSTDNLYSKVENSSTSTDLVSLKGMFTYKYRFVKNSSGTTRGPISRTIIETRKSVYSTSPTTIRMNLGGKSFTCPDGAYVWKEDNNYNSY